MEQTLPKNREAEQVVLGAALIEAENVMVRLLDHSNGRLLQPADFYFRAHQIIHQVLIEFFESGQPIDPITVGNRLEEKNVLPEIGGRSYLSELISAVTTTTSVGHYAEIIKKKAVLRRLVQAGLEISEMGYDEDDDLDEVMRQAEDSLFQITNNETRSGDYRRPDAKAVVAHLEKVRAGEIEPGISTGFKKFDRMTGGLHPHDLYIFSGRPSMGKTANALQIGLHIAKRHGKRVVIFSAEMDHDSVVDRLIALEAHVNLLDLREGRIRNEAEWARVKRAEQVIDTLHAVA